MLHADTWYHTKPTTTFHLEEQLDHAIVSYQLFLLNADQKRPTYLHDTQARSNTVMYYEQVIMNKISTTCRR